MSRPTSERNREIVRLRVEEGLTLEVIGARYGVTRERIRQILESEGVTNWNRVRQVRAIRRVFRAVAVVARHEQARAHGTSTRYNLGCSCGLCRAANNDRSRSRLGEIPPNHGASGYQNYRCRCSVCSDAHRAVLKAQIESGKRLAWAALATALRRGKLTKPTACEDCGGPGLLHGHHEDYSKPLEVDWLCTGCHGARHAPDREREIAA